MAEQDFFHAALANFMFDTASSGAIRHLADRGYTVEQIRKHLDFPTPYDRIQKTVWEHFLHTSIRIKVVIGEKILAAEITQRRSLA